jgi:hypothetical protein
MDLSIALRRMKGRRGGWAGPATVQELLCWATGGGGCCDWAYAYDLKRTLQDIHDSLRDRDRSDFKQSA